MQAQRALVATGLGPHCTSEPAKVLPRARRLPSASVWLQVCPCDPHNGKKRRAAAVKPAGRASDAQLLALLRDARRPPRCRGFLRVLLGAAAALGAGRLRWQLVCRSGRGNLRIAVGGLAPAASSGRHGSRLVAPGSGLGACRATWPERRSRRRCRAASFRGPPSPPTRPPTSGRSSAAVVASKSDVQARSLGASSSRCRFSATAGAVPGRRARPQPSAQSQWSAWWRPLTACRPWARPRPAASIPLLAPHPDPTPPRPRTKRL